ncbi:MAG: EscU/YscU/HrcU family type III secretion system export apparatus switch protein [Anaerocolumna sp.]
MNQHKVSKNNINNKDINNKDINNKDNKDFMDKTAIALGYNPDDAAPRIIATGKGYLAEKILKSAQVNQVPVHQDHKLANALSRLDLGEYIPPELYEVVSEVLIFVNDLDTLQHKLKYE